MNVGNLKRTYLQNSGFFKAFSDQVLDAIIPFIRECTVKDSHVIFLKGDPSDCMYIVHEGSVEISVTSRNGKIIVLDTLQKGDIFGEIGLLDHDIRTATAIATTDAILYRIGNQDFRAVLPLFGVGEWMAITVYICQMFRRVASSLEETAFLDSDIRIAIKIMELQEKTTQNEENAFSVTISQENLGKMAGISREATNKALTRLSASGLIRREYKTITVPDAQKLAETIEDGNI